MNENKAFLMYYDMGELFELLTDEQAGKLMRLIFAYVNGEDPAADECEQAVRIMYAVLTRQISRGNEKQQELHKRRSGAATAREAQKKALNIMPDHSDAQKSTADHSDAQSDITITRTKTKTGTVTRESCAPSPEEVSDYCKKRGSSVDPKTFFDYYEASGWKKNGSAIEDWRAQLRLWENREKTRTAADRSGQSASYNVSDIENITLSKYRALA